MIAHIDRAVSFIGEKSVTAGILGIFLYGDEKHARQAGLLLKRLVDSGLVECDDRLTPRVYRLTKVGKAAAAKSVSA